MMKLAPWAWFVIATLCILGLLSARSSAAAPTRVTFWHYIGADSGAKLVATLAEEFNAAQPDYNVVVVQPGDYKVVQIKLLAALAARGELPSLVQVDNGFFTRLALGGLLENQNDRLSALPRSVIEDFDETLLDYGDVAGQRLGLPWAESTLVQLYNADALRAKGLAQPRTWQDFVAVTRALTSRSSRGAIFFTDGWIFGSMVSSRGGSLLRDGRPALDSPEAVATLQMMYDLGRSGQSIVRTFAEANLAVIDWVRTKAHLVTLPTSAYPLVKDLLPFNVGAVSMPGKTLTGESQLVVPAGIPRAESEGAFAFWTFLTKPENLARLARTMYYLPLRRSSEKLLGAFTSDPVMRAGLEALTRAENPPQLKAYSEWRPILESALERSLKGGIEPKIALAEAQRQALALR